MPRARKKPVDIDYERFVGDTAELMRIYNWIEDNTQGSFEPMDVIHGLNPYPSSGVAIDPRDGRMIISTLEGLHWVDPGDIVIRGVAGEFYPCKPDIFAKTYDVIEDE